MQFSKIANKINDIGEERLKAVFTNIDYDMKNTSSSGRQIGDISCPRIARFLLLYAYSLTDERRRGSRRISGKVKKTSSASSPNWSGLAEEINTFAISVEPLLKGCVCKTYTPAQVSQFSTLSTRSRGPSTKYFYVTLLFFLNHIYEFGKTDTEFCRLMIPRDDHTLHTNAMRLIYSRLNQKQSGNVSEDSEQYEVRVRFNVRGEGIRRLNRYVDHYSFGDDQGAHFVLYRPLRSDPNQLVKSFLAISPPNESETDESGFVFTHIYKAPTKLQHDFVRFSGGKVLPLENGVFFVGGARELRDEDEGSREPFNSIKAIAVNWIDIERDHQIVPAAIMSTNYKGQIIVSRAALRATPLFHSKMMGATSTTVEQLPSDLLTDIRKEMSIIKDTCDNDDSLESKYIDIAARFVVGSEQAEISAISDTILEYTNNNPNADSGWSVPAGYSRRSGKSSEQLSRAKLANYIEESIDSSTKGGFLNSNNEPFELWRDARFGPLAI